MTVLRSTDRCTSLCSYPCAKDHRTRQEKIEAMATGRGTSEGERANARKMLGQSKPKPKTGTTADVLGRYGAPSTARTYITRQEADRVWELLREMMKDPDSTFFAGSRFTDATRVNPHQAQLCKLKGHDWVEIGKSMFHTPIKRCVRCGEYDPPRKET